MGRHVCEDKVSPGTTPVCELVYAVLSHATPESAAEATMTASQGNNGGFEQLPPRRTPEWFAALGFDKSFGLHTANWWEKLSFGWGSPLLEKGSYGQIVEEMADCLPPPEDEAPLRANQFAECYDQCQVWR